jgi:site-specific DNA-methyltransferase (adenine-specific)
MTALTPATTSAQVTIEVSNEESSEASDLVEPATVDSSAAAAGEETLPARSATNQPGHQTEARQQPVGRLIHANNLDALATFPDETFTLIHLDPPFNTGRPQRRVNTTAVRRRAGRGSIAGFKGQAYKRIKGDLFQYDDSFENYWEFLEPRLLEAWRLLTDDGTLYLHLDYREAHYAKVLLDALFGRDSFLNEIIWAYDYGAKSKNRWPTKHDTILVYVKNPSAYYFDSTTVDREPYMAPGLVTAEKVARGKLPTDVWWHTIVSPTGKEKTGYPTQKPEGILRRMIQASSREGDWVLDFFAGSGTTGAAAATLGRRVVLIDQNHEAISIIKKRLPWLEIETMEAVEPPELGDEAADVDAATLGTDTGTGTGGPNVDDPPADSGSTIG